MTKRVPLFRPVKPRKPGDISHNAAYWADVTDEGHVVYVEPDPMPFPPFFPVVPPFPG